MKKFGTARLCESWIALLTPDDFAELIEKAHADAPRIRGQRKPAGSAPTLDRVYSNERENSRFLKEVML